MAVVLIYELLQQALVVYYTDSRSKPNPMEKWSAKRTPASSALEPRTQTCSSSHCLAKINKCRVEQAPRSRFPSFYSLETLHATSSCTWSSGAIFIKLLLLRVITEQSQQGRREWETSQQERQRWEAPWRGSVDLPGREREAGSPVQGVEAKVE